MILPDKQEISEAITGSVKLVLHDTQAYRHFNCTADGFWRSFAAIVLIAPFFLAYAGFERALVGELGVAATMAAPGVYYAAKMVALLVDWAAYPVVIAVLARWLGFSGRYALYIIAYNWSSLLVLAALSPSVVLYGLGIIAARYAIAMSLMLTAYLIYYRWYVARTALEIPAVTAAGLVALDLALSMVINTGIDRLFAIGG